jgi:uncharacterized integral membrane protein (TIGR00697 family)
MNNPKIRYSYCLIILSMLSMTMCVTANIISANCWPFFGGAMPSGVFIYPFVYVISDIISEVYGYKISRWNAWVTLLSSLFVTYFALFITAIPHVAWSIPLNEALKVVFKSSIWVVFGSILSSVMGGWVNDIIFQYYKHLDGEPGFAKRKLLSSLAAEAVDTVIFISVAFGIGNGMFKTAFTSSFVNSIWFMIIFQFILKYGIEVITEPLAHLFANKIKAVEGDVFEDRNKFNIFGFYKA